MHSEQQCARTCSKPSCSFLRSLVFLAWIRFRILQRSCASSSLVRFLMPPPPAPAPGSLPSAIIAASPHAKSVCAPARMCVRPHTNELCALAASVSVSPCAPFKGRVATHTLGVVVELQYASSSPRATCFGGRTELWQRCHHDCMTTHGHCELLLVGVAAGSTHLMWRD